MRRTVLLLLLFLVVMMGYAQEPLRHEKKTYSSPDGKLYIQKSLPVYIWLSVSPDQDAEKYRLSSEVTTRYSNPMYFDTEGYNSVRSPSAVDPDTRNTVYPLQDIIFEVYADGIAPKTSIDFGQARTYRAEGKLHLGSGTIITLSAKDEMSGLDNIYYSLDGNPFKPYTEAIPINQEKEYTLKFYAVDHVGNVEQVHEYILLLDKTSPLSEIEVEGDRFENILSARSKISIKTIDKGIGTHAVYYSLDQGAEKLYSSSLLAGSMTQDEHSLSYYAVDKVGNKEEPKSFVFYVDKTAPTIIEEIIGKSFFLGGKEFSSGRTRLKLTSFDNKAGVKEVRYSVNDGEYVLYDSPVFLTQSSGNLLIKSFAVDNVNNRSSSQTANDKTSIPYIDLTGPELNYALKGPQFTTRDTLFISRNTSIILKGTDPEAGLNHISYSVNGSNPVDFTGAFSIEEEGFSTIEYTGFDNVDNTTGKSLSLKVDNTGPAIMLSFGTGWLRKENTLSVYPSHTVLFLSATDLVSGFQRIVYTLNGLPEKESSGMIRDLPKGKNTLLVKAYDKLGNSTETELSFIIE